MDRLKNFWQEEDAVGIVEIILILVILVALVLIFKTQIGKIVTKALKMANKDAGGIIND